MLYSERTTLLVAKLSDLELLTRYSNNYDIKAFNCLYKRYRTKAIRMLNPLANTSVRLSESAESAYNYAMAKLVDTYKRDCSMFTRDELGNWIIKTARNILLDEMKKRNNTMCISESEFSYVDNKSGEIKSKLDKVSDNERTPEDVYEGKEEMMHIMRAIKALPPMQQQTIYDHYIDELNAKEICEKRGIGNVNVINSRIFEGTKTLRKMLRGAM